MTHFLAQKEIIQGRGADVVKELLEHLIHDFLVNSVNVHHFQKLIKSRRNRVRRSSNKINNDMDLHIALWVGPPRTRTVGQSAFAIQYRIPGPTLGNRQALKPA